MTVGILKLVDSAFVLAILTGLLYFWGVCNLEGDASGLGIPAAFIVKDLWGTVSYGAEGALASTLLLLIRLFTHERISWLPIATLSFTVLLSASVCYFSRLSKYRVTATLTAVAIMMSLHIQLFSQNEMIVNIERVTACSLANKCDHVPAPNRIIFLKRDNELDERLGILINAGKDFVIMQTHKGLFILPISNIKGIETVPREAIGS